MEVFFCFLAAWFSVVACDIVEKAGGKARQTGRETDRKTDNDTDRQTKE